MAAVRDFRDDGRRPTRRPKPSSSRRRHLVQPWPYAGSIGTEARSLIGSGDGIYIIDGDGKRLIDGPAGMWCVNVGHRREELARVMYDQAMELSYNTPWYTMNEPSAELSERIADYAPGDLNHVFFTTGGSSAVETRAALHAVLQQCARPAREEADPRRAAAPITARPICRRRSTAGRATATGWTAPTSWSSSCPRPIRSAGRRA